MKATRECKKPFKERDIGKLGRKCDFLVETKATFQMHVSIFLKLLIKNLL